MGCVLQSSTIGNDLFWREAKLHNEIKWNYQRMTDEACIDLKAKGKHLSSK